MKRLEYERVVGRFNSKLQTSSYEKALAFSSWSMESVNS